MDQALHLACENCGAALEIGAQQRTVTCPYCASPAVIERPASGDRPLPLFVVGFKLTRDQAAAQMRRWARRQSFGFRRGGLARAPVTQIQGVYVPAYLYSAQANTDYVAEIGEHYTVRQGKHSRTETEWFDLCGRHSAYLSDFLVTASRGIDNSTLEALEPYDFRELRRYRPEFIAGWITEEPSLTGDQCLELAHAELRAKIRRRIEEFLPGDTHKLKDCQVQLDQQVIELIYVPVWCFAIKYHPAQPPLRVLVNGQTGQIWGKAPVSWLKVSAVLMILFIIVVLIYLFSRFH